MSNRFERELPGTSWQYAVPPIGPDGHQVYLARARQARAEVVGAAFRTLARTVAGAFAATVRFLAAPRPGPARRRPARLTAGCG